jgi:hypothetical protein
MQSEDGLEQAHPPAARLILIFILPTSLAVDTDK